MKKVTSAARLAEAYERLDAAAGKPGGALRRVGKTLSEPWLMTQLTLLLCLNLLHGLQQSTTGLLRYAVAGVLAHAVFSSTDAVSVFAENQAARRPPLHLHPQPAPAAPRAVARVATSHSAAAPRRTHRAARVAPHAGGRRRALTPRSLRPPAAPPASDLADRRRPQPPRDPRAQCRVLQRRATSVIPARALLF